MTKRRGRRANGQPNGGWWRAYDRSLNNLKLVKLSDAEHRFWFNIMCIASAHDPRGHLPSAEDLAAMLRLPPDVTVKWALHFVTQGLLVTHGDRYIVHDWDEMQYPRDNSVNRVRRHRERKKLNKSNAVESSDVTRYTTVTETVTPPLRNALQGVSKTVTKRVTRPPEKEKKKTQAQTQTQEVPFSLPESSSPVFFSTRAPARKKNVPQRPTRQKKIPAPTWCPAADLDALWDHLAEMRGHYPTTTQQHATMLHLLELHDAGEDIPARIAVTLRNGYGDVTPAKPNGHATSDPALAEQQRAERDEQIARFAGVPNLDRRGRG